MDVYSKKSHGRGKSHGYFNQLTYRFCRGLTLLELMTSIAALSITVSAGVPSLINVANNNKVRVEINQLRESLRYAWSEAILRNKVVVACPSPDGKNCIRSQNWEQGWILFVDNDGDRVLGENDAIMRVYEPMPKAITATYRAFGPRGQYIPFYPTDGMRTNGTFSVCVAGNVPELNRALIVSKARPRISKTMRDGSPVRCKES
ncbi:MAG: GspH/FimT family pseudopilin [Gammaproteobacteria bacterium]|nr:GspH/FimT family pseudopilin [Gammaproteobacteria bacterium]MDH5778282.1 GspH/FimT family pseudopilin [Gammaproteobacteria bacterium]